MKLSIKHIYSSFLCSKHSFIYHMLDGCNLLGAVEVGGNRGLYTVCAISHKPNAVKSNLK